MNSTFDLEIRKPASVWLVSTVHGLLIEVLDSREVKLDGYIIRWRVKP